MPNPNTDIIIIGGAVRLHPVRSLAKLLGIPHSTATRLLRSLLVPSIFIGPRAFFLESALEEALFTAGGFGSKGFRAPGSRAKLHELPQHVGVPKELDPATSLDPSTRAKTRKQIDRATKKSRQNILGALKHVISTTKPDADI